MGTILITRPQDSSDELAARLSALGYRCLIEPILTIMATGVSCPPLDNVQAVMITSANALTVLQPGDLQRLKHLPCFCVGPQTARKAEGSGFSRVYHSAGDGLELAAFMQTLLAGKDKAILHIAAEDYDSKADLALQQAGFTLHAWPVYRAKPADRLSDKTQRAFKAGAIDAVLVFSARTAQGLQQGLTAHKLGESCRLVTVIALSQNSGEALKTLPWRRLAVAALPSEDALIACLQHHIPVSSMSQPDPSVSANPAEKKPPTDLVKPPITLTQRRPRRWQAYAVTFLIALVCGIIAALFLIQQLDRSQNPPVASAPVAASMMTPKENPASAAPVAPTESLPAAAQTSAAPIVAAGNTPAELPGHDKDDTAYRQSLDIARLQSDVAALSATVAALQDEVKHSADLANRMQNSAQASLATTLDFMRLRDAAGSGHGFARELDLFRRDVADNNAIQPRLNQLEPLAAQAIPSLPQLHEEFNRLTPDALSAMHQAEAKNWWQRLLARLQGLVTVRHRHEANDAGDPLGKIDNDLAQNDSAALDQDLALLPPEAQTVLRSWRVQLQMRERIDGALIAIANQLAGHTDILEPAALPQASP